jgi:KaiC/GvpD/RAD55 family RecA-like ATPase
MASDDNTVDTGDGFVKLSTGIDGLDALLNGGIPEGNLTLLSGPPGTGKSTLGHQFLINGAENGYSGIYISLGEARDRIIRNLQEYGWNVNEHIDNGQLKIMSPELYKYDTLIRDMKNAARDLEADFLVLDSVTVLKSYFEDDFTIRRKIMELKKLFERLGSTTFMTAESPHRETGEIGVEEYVVDGVIELYYERDSDEFHRYIAVKKMRGTEHSMKIYPLTIGTGGITVEN